MPIVQPYILSCTFGIVVLRASFQGAHNANCATIGYKLHIWHCDIMGQFSSDPMPFVQKNNAICALPSWALSVC